ncbi:MAG: pilus assembly protein [Xanthobacteraceae bacterium]
MITKTLASRLRDQVRHFIAARNGNVAIIFALASLPVVGLIGASVDYSRANAVRADLQSALDATALMVSKNAANQSADELQKSAQAYFEALFKYPEVQSTKIAATYTADGGSAVTVSGETTIKTEFTQIMGFSELNITSSSTVKWGTSKLRVSLVLDNTGSMDSNGKMDALKTASHNLLKQLETAAQKNGDVHVAIVPFAVGVNVGKENKDAAWLDWSYFDDKGGAGDSGRGKGGDDDDKDDKDKDWDKDDKDKGKKVDKSKWQGCVMDRDQDYDVLNTTPTDKNKSTLFPATYDKDCPETLMTLSYDWKALGNKIDAMKPDGNTNQTIGLAWGWQALTQGVPLSAPVPEKDVKDVIILFTDGMNTINRWTTDKSKVDARTEKACANIKAAGVMLYTVQVKGNGDPTSKVLQNCASDGTKFFALSSANQIVTAFNTIGTNLSQLRLAK